MAKSDRAVSKASSSPKGSRGSSTGCCVTSPCICGRAVIGSGKGGSTSEANGQVGTGSSVGGAA